MLQLALVDRQQATMRDEYQVVKAFDEIDLHGGLLGLLLHDSLSHLKPLRGEEPQSDDSARVAHAR